MPIHDRKSLNIRHRGEHPQLDTEHLQKTLQLTSFMLNDERLDISPQISSQARVSSLSTPVQHPTGTPSQWNARQRNGNYTVWKVLLHVKGKTTETLEGTVKENLRDFGFGDEILDTATEV